MFLLVTFTEFSSVLLPVCCHSLPPTGSGVPGQPCARTTVLTRPAACPLSIRHFSVLPFGQVLCPGFLSLLFFQLFIWNQSPPVYRRNTPTKDIKQYLPCVLLKLSLDIWSIPFLSSQLSISECDIPRANIRAAPCRSSQFYYYNKEEPADNNTVLFSALIILCHISWTVPCSFFI